MPGLSQLKKFNKDILSLGDEITLRSARGEQPIKFPIPKDVEDKNDSEDFVLGMPEKPAVVEVEVLDEDFSDITGIVPESKNDEAPTVSFEAPDMSSLLNPIQDFSEDSEFGMPDLSAFMEEETPQPEVESEPEEISIADMDLDALLAGEGFDGSEGFGEQSKETVEEENYFDEEPESVEIPEVIEEEPELLSEEAILEEIPSSEDDDFASPSIEDLFNPSDIDEIPEETIEESSESFELDDFDLPNIDESVEIAEESTELDDFDLPNIDESVEVATESTELDDFDLPNIDESVEVAEESTELDDFDLPNIDESIEVATETSELDDFDLPNIDESVEVATETSELDDFDLPNIYESVEVATESTELDDFDLPNIDESVEVATETSELDDFSSPVVEDLFNPSDIDDYNDIEVEQPSENQEVETFDISDIENLDFDIPETDAQLGANSDNFETGNEDDFSFENQEFEIPGFSDVETSSDIVAPQPKPNANIDEVDFSGGLEGDKLPPNTLSDEQYKQFLKNFSTYPLNVRLAFENFIVQDEFTDDAEFEVIEKILNKAPARQVAALLEKMLDTSIPVPRDYEQRSAEEYEAYKKSVQYQLRNKIIPGTLIFMLMILIGWGLFNFTKHCIYIPAKANSLYKQGYALIEQNEFPQSKVKFDSAVRYRLSKNWFFKYARAYREKKQYQRSAQMYTNILRCFNNDKTAGLEYAQMELDDLANYERAEEILRREVLDYHVNDPDGILMLGDVFLEWGTEKDSSKFDLAQEQYSSLLQLYKPNDLYHSRMMRYYIRTDNLAYVLAYKNLFEPKEKSLAPEDWTELSGYLLEKMYEPLTPSEEPLRYKIEGLRGLLQRAVTTDSENPVATYNLAKYFVLTSENLYIESALRDAIEKFDNAKTLKRRDIYKYIDSYRLLGEFYVKSQDYLKAQEQFTQGISLYTVERDNAGFKGNAEIGNMYADLADINFEHSGDYIQAKENYKNAINLGYDNSSIRYRIGYIQYQQKNYLEALGSFMKAGEGNLKERNLLLAMANTLYLRGDDYAAEGYYAQLIDSLDKEIADQGIVFPQASEADYDIVNTYLCAANNYGVTLARLAKRTGDSSKNAHAIVQFQQSVRAWDALTRNQQTLVRLDGSNLALENIKYVSRPISTFEPSIYVEIPKTLKDKE
ncbi:MAG: hypothetical protein E7060_05645 [Treponema bryantii]|nr:hypothetical protein [Treponema bryantii]